MGGYRKMLSNTAIYAAGIMLGKLSSFLLLPLYTRYLSPADYGVLELVDLSFFVATLVGMRLGDAFFYFYFRAGTAAEKARVLSTAVLGSAAVGLTATALLWLLAGKISLLVFQTKSYEFYFRLIFTNIAFSFIQDIGFCYIRAREKAGTFVAVSTAKLALNMCLNVLFLVWFRMGVPALLWSGLIVSAAAAVVLTAYCLRRVRPVLDARLLAGMCAYGAPVAASGLGLLFIHYADRIFLQRYASLAEVGIYSLGYKIGMLTAYIWGAFSTHWNARMFELLKRRNGDFVYVRVMTYSTAALSAGALVLGIFAKPLVGLMAAPAFGSAAMFVGPVAAGYAIKGVDDCLRSAFLLEGRTINAARVTWAGVVICFVAYTTLVPAYKSWGAVAATLVTFSGMTVMTWYEAQRVRRFAFEYGRLARIGASAASLLAAWTLLVRAEGFAAQMALGALFVLAFPVLLLATGFFDERERRYLRAAILRAGNFLRRPARPGGDAGSVAASESNP